MKKYFTRIIPLAIAALVLQAHRVLAVPGPTSNPDMGWGQTWQEKMSQFGTAAGIGTVPRTPQQVVASLVQIVLGFVGIIFLVLIISGGILWMTSAGNEQKIEKAKKFLTNAVIGLAITVVAYSIAATVVRYLRLATG